MPVTNETTEITNVVVTIPITGEEAKVIKKRMRTEIPKVQFLSVDGDLVLEVVYS